MSEKVRRMFADIADDYDRINSILSFGVHHIWRDRTVRASGAGPGDRVLDCATGTGDLAIEFKKKVGSEGYVLGTDFCKEMIELAPEKAA
ncbi:MAG: class I SAM-dependent methyltransferase, partial [Balneolaceae bacterium]|nr:class I SAM-dependent methyltransferase [Balneolaceae bacterium]